MIDDFIYDKISTINIIKLAEKKLNINDNINSYRDEENVFISYLPLYYLYYNFH